LVTALALFWPDLLLFVSLLILLIYVLAVNRISSTHKIYLAFHFAMMLWPFGQFMIAATGYPEFQLAFAKLSFSAISLIGAGWLFFVLFLTGKTRLLRGGRALLYLLPALLCVICVLWNPGNLFMSPVGGSYLFREYGPLFWLMVFIQYSYVVFAMMIMLQSLRKALPNHKRKQLAIAAFGVVVLAAFCAADLMMNVVLNNWLPIIPGPMSVGILLSVGCFVFSIHRYGMFDALKVAQRDIFSYMSMGIMVMDEQSRVLEINKGAAPFVNVSKGEIFDMAQYLQTHSSKEETNDFLYKFRYHPQERIQTEITLSGNPVRHVSIQVSPILDRSKKFIGRIVTFHDVTDLRKLVDEMNSKNEALHERNLELITIQEELFQLNQKLEKMAITDGLTGCYNRRYLMHQMEHEVLLCKRYRIPFSVLLFDIDYFKTINDRYGHLVGDEVLRSTADVVRENLRRTDILARYGGEEFTVYLPHTDREQAMILAGRIMEAVSRNRVKAGAEEITVTISMGVVSESGENLTFEDPQAYLREVFARADAALYEAKNGGRNQVVLAHG
jgi:diguanylate cyclase (GGDEF)-like protein